MSGPGQGFAGVLQPHVLDSSVWSGAFKGRFDTPHTSRWIQTAPDAAPDKLLWKVARTPFGVTESASGRLHCDMYFPGTADQVVGSGAASLTARQRTAFKRVLQEAAGASDVLRLQDRAVDQHGPSVAVTAEASQELFVNATASLERAAPELARPVLVWQSFGQKLPIDGRYDAVSVVRNLRTTFSDVLLEEVRCCTSACLYAASAC